MNDFEPGIKSSLVLPNEMLGNDRIIALLKVLHDGLSLSLSLGYHHFLNLIHIYDVFEIHSKNNVTKLIKLRLTV